MSWKCLLNCGTINVPLMCCSSLPNTTTFLPPHVTVAYHTLHTCYMSSESGESTLRTFERSQTLRCQQENMPSSREHIGHDERTKRAGRAHPSRSRIPAREHTVSKTPSKARQDPTRFYSPPRVLQHPAIPEVTIHQARIRELCRVPRRGQNRKKMKIPNICPYMYVPFF